MNSVPVFAQFDKPIMASDVLSLPQKQSKQCPLELLELSGSYFCNKSITNDSYLNLCWEKGHIMRNVALQVIAIEVKEVKVGNKGTRSVMNVLLCSSSGNTIVQLSAWETFVDELKKKIQIGHVYLFQNLYASSSNGYNKSTVEYNLTYKFGSNIREIIY